MTSRNSKGRPLPSSIPALRYDGPDQRFEKDYILLGMASPCCSAAVLVPGMKPPKQTDFTPIYIGSRERECHTCSAQWTAGQEDDYAYPQQPKKKGKKR